MTLAPRFVLALLAAAVLASPASDAAAAAGRRGTCGDPVRFIFGLTFGNLEIVGLTRDQRLVCFNETAPSSATAIGTIRGLDGDSRIVGIDFRPADNTLYGLGDAGGVYTLSLEDASAALVSRLNVALDGTAFDIDFNPTVDRLRVISDAQQNLRVNVDTGATLEDTDLVYPGTVPTPAVGVTAAAYTNNDSSPDTATTLFDLDTSLDQVVIQSPPNAGALAATGRLLVDAAGDAGFDIYSTVRDTRTIDVKAFATLGVSGRARFYRINLLSGRAQSRGTFPSTMPVVDLAVPLNQF